jgi:predicted XRE-type DNA-binding protein
MLALENIYPSFSLVEPMRAHVASYLLHNGKITKGLVVRHTCDNIGCVNPKHLVLGTQKQNIHDSINKKRNTFGTKSHLSKLEPAQVIMIRNLWAKRKMTQTKIAKKFGIKQQHVSKIVNNIKWKVVK